MKFKKIVTLFFISNLILGCYPKRRLAHFLVLDQEANPLVKAEIFWETKKVGESNERGEWTGFLEVKSGELSILKKDRNYYISSHKFFFQESLKPIHHVAILYKISKPNFFLEKEKSFIKKQNFETPSLKLEKDGDDDEQDQTKINDEKEMISDSNEVSTLEVKTFVRLSGNFVPLEGVSVEIDGKVLGYTDSQGIWAHKKDFFQKNYHQVRSLTLKSKLGYLPESFSTYWLSGQPLKITKIFQNKIIPKIKMSIWNKEGIKFDLPSHEFIQWIPMVFPEKFDRFLWLKAMKLDLLWILERVEEKFVSSWYSSWGENSSLSFDSQEELKNNFPILYADILEKFPKEGTILEVNDFQVTINYGKKICPLLKMDDEVVIYGSLSELKEKKFSPIAKGKLIFIDENYSKVQIFEKDSRSILRKGDTVIWGRHVNLRI